MRKPCLLRKALTALGWAALLFVAGVGSSAAVAAPPGSTEYRIKAAFLYNFSRFIEWPDAAIGDAEGVFRVCVFGADPFGDALDDLSGKRAGDRVLEVRRVADADTLRDCQIVFVSGAERARQEQALAVLRGTPVLTVSDGGSFVRDGGVIGFRLARNKIRFDINVDAARRAGLVISSKLLRLATIFNEPPER